MTGFLSLEALAALIPDGAHVAIPPDYSGVAMAVTRAAQRKPRRPGECGSSCRSECA